MEALIHNFGIDWKLLLAQAVNFFILLFLLKKFAYGPILEVLKKRKIKIEDGIRFAKDAEEKLRKSSLECEAILKQAEKEALRVVNMSEETAKKRESEMLAQSNKKVEAVVAGAKRVIEEEKAKMGEELFKHTRDLVERGIIKVLGKLPQKERDTALIEAALRELKAAK